MREPGETRRPLNECGKCGCDFNSIRLFDAHRVGKHAYLYLAGLPDGRRCLTVDEMLNRGWTTNANGRWTDPKRAQEINSRPIEKRALCRDGVDPGGHASRDTGQAPAEQKPANRTDPVSPPTRDGTSG
jgi:hypothetical protein